MKIEIDISKSEFEYYKMYCELFETNPEIDLTEYVQARSSEMEKYLEKGKMNIK